MLDLYDVSNINHASLGKIQYCTVLVQQNLQQCSVV